MGKDNLEKTKGIRLKGKRLEWWENTPGVADKVRKFIDKQIKEDNCLEQIKKAPPELLEEFRKLIEKLEKRKKTEHKTDENKVEEMKLKINSLINF
ncbi:hypothetical protein MWH28_08740 [Natroniella sulfidigena]|uniref:hypothetical protein n=1 Tax=Natroniella sulfidigena TaxID=723921 RepID=UPI00200B3688|nr:hypothetical protein [Natroniella sulfidigena]MCK8817444.1 hypothetical protein [Natroniella sulfidigena]